jgi:hypothetical protein
MLVKCAGNRDGYNIVGCVAISLISDISDMPAQHNVDRTRKTL